MFEATPSYPTVFTIVVEGQTRTIPGLNVISVLDKPSFNYTIPDNQVTVGSISEKYINILLDQSIFATDEYSSITTEEYIIDQAEYILNITVNDLKGE